MLVKSEKLIRIRTDIDDACDDVYSDFLRFREKGNTYRYETARKAHSHLLHTYLELMNAIDLIEELEVSE